MSNYTDVWPQNAVSEREKKRRLRAETTAWQRAAIGVITLSTIVNVAQCRVINSKMQEAERWQAKYTTSVAIEKDAVQAYGELVRQMEEDRETRAEQARAYEAVGEYSFVGVCTVTAYCPCAECCGRWADGYTASGLPAGPGVVAVDESIIPLGSTVIIDGQRYLAADTGVTGNCVDIFTTTHSAASEFGIQHADVWIIPLKGKEDK